MATSSSSIIDIDDIDDDSSSSSKRSEVYQFFTNKGARWHCNHCSKNFGDKATTTLWRHIKFDHVNLYKIYENQKANQDQDQENQKIGSMDKYVISSKKQVSFVV